MSEGHHYTYTIVLRWSEQEHAYRACRPAGRGRATVCVSGFLGIQLHHGRGDRRHRRPAAGLSQLSICFEPLTVGRQLESLAQRQRLFETVWVEHTRQRLHPVHQARARSTEQVRIARVDLARPDRG